MKLEFRFYLNLIHLTTPSFFIEVYSEMFQPLLFLDNVQSNKVKLSSQPRQVALGSSGKIAVVACQKSVTIFSDGKQMVLQNIEYEASCVAVAPDSRLTAVGSQVRIILIVR